jgi:hypothetical protein
MNTDQMKPLPMTEDQLEDVKKEIIETYLYLVSRTGYDPKVIEVMKLSPWQMCKEDTSQGNLGKCEIMVIM